MNTIRRFHNVETGAQWILRTGKPNFKQPTGLQVLDDFLNWGFGPGHLVEINGLGGSGKTEFCFTLIAESLVNVMNLEKYIYYIDYAGSFSAKRLREILMNRFRLNEEQVSNYMKRVILVMIYNEQMLYKFLVNFTAITHGRKICLIVIENIGLMLASTVRSKEHIRKVGRQLLKNIAYNLRHLSKSRLCPLIVTNHNRNWSQGINPALGKIWSSLIPHHIVIAREKNQFYIQNFDENLKPTSSLMKFTITNKGITA